MNLLLEVKGKYYRAVEGISCEYCAFDNKKDICPRSHGKNPCCFFREKSNRAIWWAFKEVRYEEY